MESAAALQSSGQAIVSSDDSNSLARLWKDPRRFGCSVDDLIKRAEFYFGIHFIDYGREGTGILLASGCGIGMGLMDVLPGCRYFLDLDRYRYNPVDWEVVAAILSLNEDAYLILAGWFSLDRAIVFDCLERGFQGKVMRYEGGGGSSLSEFILSLL